MVLQNSTAYINSKYFNKNYIFYVCSYGGCGSWMLVKYLANFGKTYHIHSRNPPNKLKYIGFENNINKKAHNEHFNNTDIPEEEVFKYYVIYLYRNPIDAIYCNFNNKRHLYNIEIDRYITLDNLINKKEDLYKIKEFYNNYVNKQEKNYNIYCVKFEDFFNNIEYFNKTFNIPNIVNLYPIEKNKHKLITYKNELNNIYQDLINIMNNNPFIIIS